MLHALVSGANQVLRRFNREEGQDAFEYALVVGGISVVVVAAIAVLGTQAPGVVDATCEAMATILTALTC